MEVGIEEGCNVDILIVGGCTQEMAIFLNAYLTQVSVGGPRGRVADDIPGF